MARRRKNRRKRRRPFLLLMTLALCLLGGGYLYASNWFYSLAPFGANLIDQTESGELPEERINLLLLGMDARKGEVKSRTDSIILASIDARGGQAALLSIPRDTRVEIPGHGYDRINAANVYGGPELAAETVEELLGVPIDYYMLTNFNGFKDIVDTLGGVTIDVEKNMHYYDPADNFLIDLKKGTQRMDGEKAIQYVRYRNDAMGDIARTERQQKFLEALAEEMLQPSTIVKLPKLVPEIKSNIQTNLGVMDMLALARVSKEMKNMEIVSETLPGRFLTINGLSYWGVEPDQAKQVVAKLFNGEKVSDVVLASTADANSAPEDAAAEDDAEDVIADENKAAQEQWDETEAEKENNAKNHSWDDDVNVSITPSKDKYQDDEVKKPPAEEQPSAGNTPDYDHNPPEEQPSAGNSDDQDNPYLERNNAEGMGNPISPDNPNAADSGESAWWSKDVVAELDGTAW